jgi:hypothetical protein
MYPTYPIERLNYFDGQFLRQADFSAEQKYHREMRRRLNRLLHTAGIAESLDVQRVDDDNVKVAAGMAIDDAGNEILLPVETPDINVTNKYKGHDTITVAIKYAEQPSSYLPSVVPGAMRIQEIPVVFAVNQDEPLPDHTVQLGVFTLTPDGKVPQPFSVTGRTSVGAKLRPGSVDKTALGAKAVTNTAVDDGAIDRRALELALAIQISQIPSFTQFEITPPDLKGKIADVRYLSRGGLMVLFISDIASCGAAGYRSLNLDVEGSGSPGWGESLGICFGVTAPDGDMYPLAGAVTVGPPPDARWLQITLKTNDNTQLCDLSKFHINVVEIATNATPLPVGDQA